MRSAFSELVEQVWGDGHTTGRQIVSATNLEPFGNHRFRIPFETAGKKWVRFAVWDSAGNGAFTQPVEVAGRQSSRPLWTSPGCSNGVAVTPARGFSLQRRCVSRGRAVDGVNAHLVFRESQCALPLAFVTPFQESPAQQRELLYPNAITPD